MCIHGVYTLLIYVPSKISKPVTIRMTNEQIAVIDRIVENGNYANRSDACRDLIMPGLRAGMVAMQSGSTSRALTKYWAEMNAMRKKMDEIANNSKELREQDGQVTLSIDIPKLVPEVG